MISSAANAAANAAGYAVTNNNPAVANNQANDNEFLQLVQVMVDVDVQFNPDDDVAAWNTRLRGRINDRFGKGWLTPVQINSFANWNINVNNLPEDASRFAIFGCAPITALYCVGI